MIIPIQVLAAQVNCIQLFSPSELKSYACIVTAGVAFLEQILRNIISTCPAVVTESASCVPGEAEKSISWQLEKRVTTLYTAYYG